MRYFTINQVLGIYNRVMQQSGGLIGIRDLGALESEWLNRVPPLERN